MSADVEAELRGVESLILARRPEHSIDPSLDRIRDLTSLLGDPQRSYPVIHVTGTNGKTSTSRMIETLLRVRGLRTGMFTSPHLITMRERICVDGEPVSAERFIELYTEIAPYLDLVDARQPVRLSFFEVLVGMAFAAFADAPVDVAVIEVGMGGTWDNTNVADGAVAVITPVSIDHAQYLGDTVAAIAADKAGIIKPGAIAVTGQQPVDAAAALMRRAAEVGATVAREGLEFGVLGRELAVGGQRLAIRGLLGEYHDLFLPLFGSHQAGNAACALAAVEAFSGAAGSGYGGGPDIGPLRGVQGGYPPVPALAGDLVAGAFAMMTSPGRLEVVRRSPLVLVDAAHNPAGMAATAAAVTESFGPAEVIAVLAVSGDKDVAGILGELEPVAAAVVVTRNSSARSMPPDELAELAAEVFGPDRVHLARRLDDAIEIAVGLADEVAATLGGPPSGGLWGVVPPDQHGGGSWGVGPPDQHGGGSWGVGPPDQHSGLAEPGAGIAPTLVLITGSVITAGDAKLLLTGTGPAGPRGAGGTGPRGTGGTGPRGTGGTGPRGAGGTGPRGTGGTGPRGTGGTGPRGADGTGPSGTDPWTASGG